MKKLFTLIAAGLLACTVTAQEKLTEYVNHFIGTAGFGNVYPGAQVPFGGIQISPDTDETDYDSAAGYKYTKPTILGFSLTHLSGTGIPDLGDFLFVPGNGESRFSHEKESASPGYYSVVLEDSGVKAVYLNGQKLKGTTLRYEDIKDGADLLFEMKK